MSHSKYYIYPVMFLYFNHLEAEDMGNNRLNSLRSVLSSIPGTHFHVLLFLIKYWYKMTSAANTDEHKLNDLCMTLGPLILRPEVRFYL